MSLPNMCPLCGQSHDQQAVVTRHVFGSTNRSNAFFHCKTCDVRYQHPGLTSEEEAKFYAMEFEGFMASRAGHKGGWLEAERHISANESTRLRRMNYLTPHLEGVSSILEIGCSSGFMLYPLVESGYTCTGIEPSGIFSKFITERGLGNFRSIDELEIKVPKSKFDLICHFFVLEHITQPIIFLRKQIDLLKKGGKIIFEIPNVDDPLNSIYDIPAFERFYWSVAHPWYFSEKALHFLLNQLGYPFEILLDQRYDLSNHMIWARDGRPGGMGYFSSLLGEEIEVQYKQALIKNRRCDTLIGIITKDN